MRLAPVFLGSLARRRMATLFSLVAIVLGVALGMAVQAVHEAALAEFGRGLRTMAGDADLQVLGPRGGFDEALYGVLAARPEVAGVSPVIEVEARLAGREEALTVMGVDVLALAAVSPRLLPQPRDGEGRFAAFSPEAIFLSEAARQALGFEPGATLRVDVTLHKKNDDGTIDFKGEGTLLEPNATSEPPTAVSGRFLLRPVRVS